MNIYKEMYEARIPLEHKESDLHALVTPISRVIIEKYEKLNGVGISIFHSIWDGRNWFNIPDAYHVVKDIHKELKEAGVELDRHCSDLYALYTLVSNEIISRYVFKQNVTMFKCNIDKRLWYDIPFAYDNKMPIVHRAEKI